MTASFTHWYSPAPSEISVDRISLDFGLRTADLFFREMVVPELGRVWFVRQLSWPVAALKLHAEMRKHGLRPPKPTAICHGVEALACKLAHVPGSQDRSKRILGTRAFGRDAERRVWSFEELRRSANYVRNTHRQSASRALRADGGLAFATGFRFDLFELSPIGNDLAEAVLNQPVGQGGTRLGKWLTEWIKDERGVDSVRNTLREALSPHQPTEREKDIVKGRLLDTGSEKRVRLAGALGHAAKEPDADRIAEKVVPRLRQAGQGKQADEIVAALAFGAVLDRARDATSALTEALRARGAEMIATLARDAGIRDTFGGLRTASKRFLTRAATANVAESSSSAFAKSFANSDTQDSIRALVRKVDQVLILSGAKVVRGWRFRPVNPSLEKAESEGLLEDGATSLEPDRTGRTFRIANFHSLLRDIQPAKTA